MVLETLHILSGLVDKERTALMKEYEERLVNVCNYRLLDTDTVVELMIASEKFNLKNLLSTAIFVARNGHRHAIQESARYYEISDESKLRIYKQ